VAPTTNDPVDPARSAQMARIRGKDTKPEMLVRRAMHAAGLRYRLHDRRLPGSPDLVFPGRRVALFVHGCFWHRHDNPSCKLARLPKSRIDFWKPKLEGNQLRDLRHVAELEAAGWKVRVTWECELKSDQRLLALVDEIRSTPLVGQSGGAPQLRVIEIIQPGP
jgi:DNA mismatch endonuclease (patch repair protein)